VAIPPGAGSKPSGNQCRPPDSAQFFERIIGPGSRNYRRGRVRPSWRFHPRSGVAVARFAGRPRQLILVAGTLSMGRWFGLGTLGGLSAQRRVFDTGSLPGDAYGRQAYCFSAKDSLWRRRLIPDWRQLLIGQPPTRKLNFPASPTWPRHSPTHERTRSWPLAH